MSERFSVMDDPVNDAPLTEEQKRKLSEWYENLLSAPEGARVSIRSVRFRMDDLYKILGITKGGPEPPLLR